MAKRVSIDVGGTFTDLVLVNDETGELWVDKVASIADSGEAVITGINRVAGESDILLSQLDLLVHGFTIATNAWLMRRGARVVMLVTEGYRDILALGSQRRPHTYHLAGTKPEPLVPRWQIIEIAERMDAFGAPVTTLNEKTITQAIEQVKALGPEAIAISLLFSWANGQHEQRLACALRDAIPNIPVYCSSDVNPQIEEYPRANTTAAAAYVGPPVRTYTQSLETQLALAGIKAPLRYMRSDGGAASARAARENPANMLLSGPAGGVVAAAAHGAALGKKNLITFDMGGTSADFSVIRDGQGQVVRDRVLDGLPLRVPMLEIKAISAGGGSIGWVDRGGALRVGPDSAGASPGPASYGLGGTHPTLTDAALLLGYIIPNSFAGGDLSLNRALAKQAIESEVATPLSIDASTAALGMFEVATANMAQTIRELSTERGDDVAEFALLAFGGAGGLFAPFLLRELGLREVLVPRYPGVFAALGLHFADLRHHQQMTFAQPAANLEQTVLREKLQQQTKMLSAQLERDAVALASRQFHYSAEMRYIGQHHELEVALPNLERLDDYNAATIVRAFHDLHEKRYGYCHRQSPVEFTNIHTVGIGVQTPPVIACRQTQRRQSPQAFDQYSSALGASGMYTDTPVYQRDQLSPGHTFSGPAIVTQGDSTLVILAGQEATVDGIEFIHLTEHR